MKENKRFDENDEGYKKLIEACVMCEKDYLDSLHLDELPDFEPSKRFKRNMERMLKANSRPKRRFWRSTVGKAAAIIIAVFLALVSFAVTAEALGFPVFKYIETANEKFIELFVDRSEITEYPTTIEEVYTLTGLPEGFVETEYEKDDVSVETKWENGSTEIKLSQGLLNGKITKDNEHSENKMIIHNGTEVYYQYSSGITIVDFHNGVYQFSIFVYENKTVDEMLILVDSIQIKTQ